MMKGLIQKIGLDGDSLEWGDFGRKLLERGNATFSGPTGIGTLMKGKFAVDL